MADRAIDTAPPELPRAAAAIVEGLTGSPVSDSRRLYAGMMTFKCRVLTERGDDIMVRFYPEGRATVVDQEPDLLARCRAAGLPVPVAIGDSRTGPPAPLNYVAYHRITGATLAERLPSLDEAQRQRVAVELSDHLGHLRHVAIKGAGDLVSATLGGMEDWDRFVDQAMQEGVKAIRAHALTTPGLADAIEHAVRRGGPGPTIETGRLVWGDINFNNVLLADDTRIVALIDFESCLGGDPLATWGYGYAAHGPDPFFRLLLDARPELLLAERLPWIAWYALLRALRLARYAHLALPTGRPRDPLVHIFPGLEDAVSILEAAQSRRDGRTSP